ncbi:MAG TPA: xanthine dehydrogenase family protein molybdopterin-binding subunit [Acetobacteraceae bacterium]|nr:xanthine dehydrogenase family protein molybdopterin-binding subunit [Acetobacteraceae bacterium]
MDARGAEPTGLEKFGVGQPVSRKEDPVLLQGRGEYSDDANLSGQSYAAFVRSREAHGRIRSIATADARAMPGVVGLFTGADLIAAGLRPAPPGVLAPNRDGSRMRWPAWYPLAHERVRYVGEPVAMVVADTVAQARDAAEAVGVEIDTLPAVLRPQEATAPGAPELHDGFAGNVVLDFHTGDTDATAAAFARAAHRVRLPIVSNRVVVNAMEPRASLAAFDAGTGRSTIRLACQGAFAARAMLAHVLGVPREQVRVLTGQVGGSFGMKAHPLAEDYCLLHAARALGRPVKWTDLRTDSFLSDTHGRDHEMLVELALDDSLHFLALRLTGFGNMGAYMCQGGAFTPAINQWKNTPSVYRTPLIEVAVKCVLTNTVPVGAYRGNGRPEANYYVERVIDTAAAAIGVDPAELRRRNHVRPEDMPYRAPPSGLTYDSGDFPAVLERVLQLSDWEGFPARHAASAARGLLRGHGIGQYLEVTGAPGPEMGGIRFEPDGRVTIITGTLDSGQGHASSFAQVLATHLGVPFERIRLIQGDSDELVAGSGTGGSKSMAASGGAVVEASLKVIELGRRLAAHLLEAAEVDIAFEAGRFAVVGTDRGIDIMDLAERLHAGETLPDDVPHSLDVSHVHDGVPSAFPNGCHVAEVEIDPETGVIRVVRYTSVNDFGTLVNPQLVEGQAHGGIVQGLGQAFLERTVYDADGQLVTGSFMDYAMPRAADCPPLSFNSLPSPALTNPLGVKGCGEAGCAGAITSLMNAVMHALRPLGVRQLDMPATPLRVWQAIQEARAAGS